MPSVSASGVGGVSVAAGSVLVEVIDSLGAKSSSSEGVEYNILF